MHWYFFLLLNPMFIEMSPEFSVGAECYRRYPFALEINLRTSKICRNGQLILNVEIQQNRLFF